MVGNQSEPSLLYNTGMSSKGQIGAISPKSHFPNGHFPRNMHKWMDISPKSHSRNMHEWMDISPEAIPPMGISPKDS